MEFGGKYLFKASREDVWSALNDSAMLQATIPGCTDIKWVSDSSLEATISVNLGIARPVFTGDLELSDVEPAARYTLSGRGRGGLLGHAHGAADIALSDYGDDTILDFTAEAGASGQLMRLGKTVIGSSAQKVIDGFFNRFASAMGVAVTPLDDL